jgi:hypothetical protein
MRFFGKVDVKEPILDRATPTRTQSPPNRLTSLDFKEGLTDREYYALSSSISQIETVDPSQVF